MATSIQFTPNNGNAKTVVTEDKTASPFFWSNYFTHSYIDQKDDFFFESNVDLMGNPMNNKYERTPQQNFEA